jgi:hypothetical protein
VIAVGDEGAGHWVVTADFEWSEPLTAQTLLELGAHYLVDALVEDERVGES